jgi:GT2 family glycosyltransferase
MDKILFVIVLYKTKLEESTSFITLSENLESLNSLAELVVYDNSPGKINQGSIIKIRNWSITYIQDPSNPGISKAYNEAFKIGKKQHKQWLLVVDQDTFFPPDALTIYLASLKKFPDAKLFAPVLKSNQLIVSPTRYILKRGFPLKQVKPGLNSLDYISPINSGLFINLEAFEKAGGYNEKVKLDFSDYQFIERFKQKYQHFVLMDLICIHGLSTNDNSTLESSLTRYRYFCEGAYFSTITKVDKFLYWGITIFRALSLAKQFKTLIFLKENFKFWTKRW